MKNGNFSRLSAYSNSDWAGDIAIRKSTRGYTIQLNCGLVAWRSFKQHGIVASTSEAGHVSLMECIRKVRCRHCILRELGDYMILP